ncbi:MAG: hypothetical protein D6160_10385 [Ketobacter sp.]|nr:MAG: hypothetical protein D6160_10385 [Ketobacter sp.]
MLTVFESQRPGCWLRCTLVTCFLLGPQLSYGELVNNLTIGNPIALALGNAVTADPPGVDSIHFNPAGLARLKGREALFKVAAASFNFDVEFGHFSPQAQAEIDKWGYDDSVDNTRSQADSIYLKVPFVGGRTEWPLDFLVVPTGGAAFAPEGANYTIGTAAYSPMAAGYGRNEDNPGRFMGREMALTRITYFSPTIGFKLNDEWSIGAGIHFSYQGISAFTDLRVPNVALAVVDNLLQQLGSQANCLGLSACEGAFGPFDQAATLEVDVETGLSTTFSFGLLWEPTSWLTWGMVYESEAMNRMEGSYRMTYSDDWQAVFGGLNRDVPSLVRLLGLPNGLQNSPDGVGIQTGDARVNLKTPAHFSTGISVQILPAWKFNMDAKWTDWEVWDGLHIDFDEPQEFARLASVIAPKYSDIDKLIIPRHYESVWNFAFGVEHQYSDRLTLRAGWEPRKSSIPWHKQDVLLPIGDGNLYSIGFGYDWKKEQRFDFALGYYHTEANVPAGSSTNANSEDQLTNFLYNPYAGLNFTSEITAYLVEFSYNWQF